MTQKEAPLDPFIFLIFTLMSGRGMLTGFGMAVWQLVTREAKEMSIPSAVHSVD